MDPYPPSSGDYAECDVQTAVKRIAKLEQDLAILSAILVQVLKLLPQISEMTQFSTVMDRAIEQLTPPKLTKPPFTRQERLETQLKAMVAQLTAELWTEYPTEPIK